MTFLYVPAPPTAYTTTQPTQPHNHTAYTTTQPTKPHSLHNYTVYRLQVLRHREEFDLTSPTASCCPGPASAA